MRIGLPLPYAGTIKDSVDQLRDLSRAGASIVFVAEVYTFDAVSTLGYLAASVPGVELATNILPLYTRTPSLLAMTAAGLDHLSGGRFTLGIGASGPQVIEGFHGLRYDAPVGRTRDIVDICRQVWRREKVQFDSPRYHVPLTPEHGGSGLGKPLKIINHPVRERIPILIAGMGPKNVALAAELAEAWSPFFFRPEGWRDVFGGPLGEGFARRAPELGELDVTVPIALGVTDDPEPLLDAMRGLFSLYIGGMGARGKNFYFDLAARYGFEAEARLIQDLYLDGKKEEAAAAVPVELLRTSALVGPRSWIKERVQLLHDAGVRTLAVQLMAPTPPARVRDVETLAGVIAELGLE